MFMTCAVAVALARVTVSRCSCATDVVIAPTALHMGLAQTNMRREFQLAGQNIWTANVRSATFFTVQPTPPWASCLLTRARSLHNRNSVLSPVRSLPPC